MLGDNGHRPEAGKGKLAKRREVDPPGFVAFWAGYPRKEGRGDAVAKWRKLDPDAALVAAIMRGLDRWRASDTWARGFRVHASTWLHQRRWEDEPAPASGLSPKTSANVDAGRRFVERMRGAS